MAAADEINVAMAEGGDDAEGEGRAPGSQPADREMWRHQLGALGLFVVCLSAWVGTALYRAHAAEARARDRLGRYSEKARAIITSPGRSEPDVRADRRALLLNPFQKNPAVYLYLDGRRVAQLHF